MKSLKRMDVQIVAIAVLFVVMVMFLMVSKDTLRLPPTIDEDFIRLLPGIVVVVLGLYLTATTRNYFSIASMFAVGIALAFLVGEMDDLGMVTVDMLNGLTVDQLQLWIVVVSTILGGVVGVSTSRS